MPKFTLELSEPEFLTLSVVIEVERRRLQEIQKKIQLRQADHKVADGKFPPGLALRCQAARLTESVLSDVADKLKGVQ
jgi:hypothetical protein